MRRELRTQLVRDVRSGAGNGALRNPRGRARAALVRGRRRHDRRRAGGVGGTTAGTRLVKDIDTGLRGSSPQALTDACGTLLFSATTLASGRELWRTDGTGPGTSMVNDIFAGSTAGDPTCGAVMKLGGLSAFPA